MLNKTIGGTLMAALLLAPAGASAVPFFISGSTGESGLGSFTGTFDYTAGDDFNATIVVTLNNTSPAANGGFLTAFAFNIPLSLDDPPIWSVSGASLDSFTLLTFDTLLGGAPPSDSVGASPYGQFDIGAAIGDSWQGSGPGGGSPSNGIGVGSSATFTFSLTGTGLLGLSTQDFLSTLSVGPGDGAGNEEFVARFRGFNDGGSDKVPVDTSAPVPEPGTLALVGLGLASLSARRMASRKQ